jgi:hypothetical protein
MLPSLEYSPLVYRWVGADSPIQPFQRIPYTVLGATAFGPQSIVALVLGDVRSGKSDMTAYFGVLPLLLVIIGGWKCWRNPLVKYLVGLAVVVWIYSWASSSLLHGILYLVPLLDISREADRFYYLTNFATALLAGFGAQLLFIDRNADELASLSKLLSVLKWAVIAFAGLLVLASLHLTAELSEKTYLSFFLLAASYTLLVFLQKPRETRAAQFIAIFLIAWDLYSFGSMIQDKNERQKINGDALAHLVYHRNLAGYIKSQPGMPRVHFDMEAGPNIGNTYAVPITWAMGATLLKDFSAGYGSQRQFDLLGVRYIVRPKSVASSAAPVYEDHMWKAYENPTALPRAWVVHRVESDQSDRNFDLRRVALIDHPLDTTLSESSNDAADTVRWLRYEPNLVEVEVTTETAGLLVLGEVYYPGWNAQVDGTPAKIYRTDELVRGVSVTRGTHRVLLRYQPASVRWGAILTILTFVLVCGGACYTLRPLS